MVQSVVSGRTRNSSLAPGRSIQERDRESARDPIDRDAVLEARDPRQQRLRRDHEVDVGPAGDQRAHADVERRHVRVEVREPPRQHERRVGVRRRHVSHAVGRRAVAEADRDFEAPVARQPAVLLRLRIRTSGAHGDQREHRTYEPDGLHAPTLPEGPKKIAAGSGSSDRRRATRCPELSENEPREQGLPPDRIGDEIALASRGSSVSAPRRARRRRGLRNRLRRRSRRRPSGDRRSWRSIRKPEATPAYPGRPDRQEAAKPERRAAALPASAEPQPVAAARRAPAERPRAPAERRPAAKVDPRAA